MINMLVNTVGRKRIFNNHSMTDRGLKTFFVLLATALLITLLIKLTSIPGGLILSGLFLGSMILVAIIIGCLLLTPAIRLLCKKFSFLTIFSILATLSFSTFHYHLYSPTLVITVPNGYTGKVSLVQSNTKNNILTLDSNGIGYLDRWTFGKVYTKPIVKQIDGKNLDKNLVGFNPSAFFGGGKSCCIDGLYIQSISFEIVPDDKTGQKQYYSKDLMSVVDKQLVLLSKPDRYTSVDTAMVILDTLNSSF